MKKLFILIFALIAVFSCEKTIPIEMEKQDPKIVINALFDNTKSFSATITRSAMIDNIAGPLPITDAVVKLFENGTLIDTLIHIGNGIYELDDTLQPGNTYELNVSCEIGIASAVTTMPDIVPIISIDSIVETQIINDNDIYAETLEALMVYYTFQDQPGDQFYSLKFIANQNIESLGYTDVGALFYYEYNYRTSSSGVDQSSAVDLYEYLRFSDGLFDEELKTYKFGVQYEPYDLQYYIDNNFNFKLRFYTLSESFYTYLQTLEAYYNAEGDFFAESINLYSNVEGGLGIFAGATLHEVDVNLGEVIYR